VFCIVSPAALPLDEQAQALTLSFGQAVKAAVAMAFTRG
jgi:hypothetical protein